MIDRVWREAIAGFRKGVAEAGRFVNLAPSAPSPKVAITIRRSGRKYVDGVEWLPDSYDDQPLDQPVEDTVLGMKDTVTLRHDVVGYDKDGREILVSQTFHLTFRSVPS